MAGLRVFVSSTCYDFSMLRSELRNFIISFGYDPIMSDYADVVYDPRIHTHTSCVEEVVNCDMLIVIIGSRFGGKSVPEALDKVDVLKLIDDQSASAPQISITQLEVMKAIECNIPVYSFIEKKVWYEHEIYEKNKGNPDVLDKIVFPAIDKQETAKYIFSFINSIRLRSAGNSIFTFERIQDIEDTLKKQWSGYFQRLLNEQRHHKNEHRQIDALSEKFEDLKTAILSSFEKGDQREIANGVVRYRRLIDFLIGIHLSKNNICNNKCTFNELLNCAGIVDVVNPIDIDCRFERRAMPRAFMVCENEMFYECRFPYSALQDFDEDWKTFSELPEKTKEIIFEALSETSRSGALIRYHREPFGKYINEQMARMPSYDE